MLIAYIYIFSSSAATLMGWGQKLFTSVTPPGHWFPVPVGR